MESYLFIITLWLFWFLWCFITTRRSQMSLEEMHYGLKKVITSVMTNRDSWPFREPIKEAIAPMYYEIIQNPIDLSAIEKKIDDQVYSDFREVEEDFKLLVNNCETYNGPKNGYTLLSYAVWRVFKRATKRFLDLDLSFDEQVAFIYPPKPRNLATQAAIKARRKRRKHRKLRALDILAKAAEEAVKCTTLRGTRSDGSGDSSSSSSSSSSPYQGSRSEGEGKFDGKKICISVEALSDCDSNSNFPCHLTLNLNIGIDEGNLTFKSLSEWSDYIRLRGDPVKLPQESVILPQTPLSRTSGHLHSNEIRLFRSLCLSELKEKETQSSSINLDDRLSWPFNSESSSSSSNCSPPQNQVHKPIVIKLSRCNSDNGTIWKPVQVDNNHLNSPGTDSNMKNVNEQSPCSLPMKKIHPRNSIGEEGLNCLPKKRLALDNDVFCHNYLNGYNTQTSSSDESNSLHTDKLLNFTSTQFSQSNKINHNHRHHPCLSEDSSMDSSSD
ncbi:uncharacterized protein LOC107359224 isoform X1 [Tetranychus urticae]|uniref:uncharacterized protein LOC107359224 isoform X1 n=1 Tax=Tetranychus urticae TaxID=32264 RepID=UPI000D65DA4E|nr:uncharacterized protein LOC107359224 isoform X1 [Tetranychus urticae]